MLSRTTTAVAALVGLVILYTSSFGSFWGLVQRASFVGLGVSLGLLMFPLGAGKRWRSLGIAIDLAAAVISVAACVYVITHYDEIMNDLPTATTLDIVLTAGLEIGRAHV